MNFTSGALPGFTNNPEIEARRRNPKKPVLPYQTAKKTSKNSKKPQTSHDRSGILLLCKSKRYSEERENTS